MTTILAIIVLASVLLNINFYLEIKRLEQNNSDLLDTNDQLLNTIIDINESKFEEDVVELSDLTVKELRKLAKKNNISLGKARKKADIIKLLK